MLLQKKVKGESTWSERIVYIVVISVTDMYVCKYYKKEQFSINKKLLWSTFCALCALQSAV